MEETGFKIAVVLGLLVAVISVSTVQGACKDELDNCKDYGSSVCTEYAAWSKKNCANMCHFCGGGQAPGCTFNGRKHADGSNWLEGCKARCQCKLSKGKFPIICNALCWDYDIPSRCSWNPPKSGKCCRTPNCPAGVKVNYPSGYSYWGEDVDMNIIPWN